MRLSSFTSLFGLALALWTASPAVHAQALYPDHPITIVVPYAAGGPMDKLARQLAAHLKPSLGQAIIVQNQPGAGGNIGASAVKRAAPDGYTLLLDHIHMATAPALYRKLDFQPDTDFEPLGVIAESPLVLVSRPDVPAASVTDLLRWMARQPQVTLANAGVGSASHLCGMLLQSSLKISMTTVPYRGTGPAMLDLLGGQVDLMCDLTANALPHITAGKVRPIALSIKEPLTSTSLASVPSFRKFGIDNVELSIWYGLYAPRGTPPVVVQRLGAGLARVVEDVQFQQQQSDAGIRAVRDERVSPAGHRRHLRQEISRWAPIIQAAGVYAD